MVSTGGAGPGAGSPQAKKKRAEARAQRHHETLNKYQIVYLTRAGNGDPVG